MVVSSCDGVAGTTHDEDDPPDSIAAGFMTVPQFIWNSKEGNGGLAQLAEYMYDTFTHQHRNFCYAIYILRKQCRLLYFDRTGAYVSTPFDWTFTTSPLHTFLWKLTRKGDPANMGYDTTATLASTDERRRFTAMATHGSVHPDVQQYVQRALADSATLYKLRIRPCPPSKDERFPDEPYPEPSPGGSEGDHDGAKAQEQEQEFIVGRPHFAAESLVGRCTRGYIALKLDPNVEENDTLCFLKDCWRPYVPGRTRPEHLVYQRLHRHGVGFIATLICGGDVGGPAAQKTKVQAALFTDNPTMQPVPRVHYRICTKEIGIPLMDFRNFRELSFIFVEALKGTFIATYDVIPDAECPLQLTMVHGNSLAFFIVISALGTS